MPAIKHYSAAATSFAQALLDLAVMQDRADAIRDELKVIRQLVDENDTFAKVLADPALGVNERSDVLRKIFDGRITPLLMNFMILANEKGRAGDLREIAAAYMDLLDKKQGRVEVDLTVAQELSSDQLDQVRQKISGTLNKTAIVHQKVDHSILGGLMVKIGDQLIDASVRYQLDSIKEQLMSVKPG
jgi:F-type H+-transporting ATPase subunit delta